MSRKNGQAWEAWCELDRYGRDVDTMSGFPLALKLETVEHIVERYDDPEAVRSRILLLESKALEFRRAEYQRKHSEKRRK